MFPEGAAKFRSLFPIEAGNEVLVAYIVWFMLLYLLLPFLRYVIGLKYWRYSTVFMLSVSLWLFLINFRRVWIGILVWLLLFIVGLSTGIAMYKYLVGKRIHYFAKVSLVLFNTLFGLAIVVWAVYLASGVSLLSSQYVAVAIALLFSALYEFVVLFSRKGWFEFLRRVGVTLVVALIWGSAPVLGYGFGLLFRWHLVIVGVAFALLVWVLARWKHLTLVEFFRFRKIVKEVD